MNPDGELANGLRQRKRGLRIWLHTGTIVLILSAYGLSYARPMSVELADTKEQFLVAYIAEGVVGYYWYSFAVPDESKIPWTTPEYDAFVAETKSRQREWPLQFQGFFLASGLPYWLVPQLADGAGRGVAILHTLLWLLSYELVRFGIIPFYFRKRASRRRRRGCCTTCGYDLTGNQSDICPECGTTFGKSNNGSILHA